MMFIWHPDKHQANEQSRLIAEEETKKINQAYEIICEAILDGSINQSRYEPNPPKTEESSYEPKYWRKQYDSSYEEVKTKDRKTDKPKTKQRRSFSRWMKEEVFTSFLGWWFIVWITLKILKEVTNW